jgi:hypothetical protein
VNKEVERMGKDMAVVTLEVLSQNVLGETDGNHGKPQSAKVVSWPPFEPDTSRTQIRNVTKSTICFDARSSLDLFFDPEDGGDVPPKRPLTFNGLHGVISHKINTR